jgi:hypothetical protein
MLLLASCLSFAGSYSLAVSVSAMARQKLKLPLLLMYLPLHLRLLLWLAHLQLLLCFYCCSCWGCYCCGCAAAAAVVSDLAAAVAAASVLFADAAVTNTMYFRWEQGQRVEGSISVLSSSHQPPHICREVSALQIVIISVKTTIL